MAHDPADDFMRTESRDGMLIDFHTPIEMDDGVVLRADVFRPEAPGRYPVLMTYGLYGKGLSFQDEVYRMQWEKLVRKEPSILEGSTNQYQTWETPDPERWVPDGYVVVRIDSRGAGWSPGVLDPRNYRETLDAYQCVEWAAEQEWSNGKVGMTGISYFACIQWRVATLKPPHLAAINPWEGFIDYYRATRHGGIRSRFQDRWYQTQVSRIQYGVGERGLRSLVTGEPAAGPVTLSEEELERNRVDLIGELKSRDLDDEWYRAHSADPREIEVPLLSAANWGGQGIHPSGNYNGYLWASSKQKWLEAHGDTHFTHYYSDYGREIQKRFFDHFLKGEDNGWDRQPPVTLNIRRPGEQFELRYEDAWPIPRTQWTQLYLHPDDMELALEPAAQPQSIEYEALGNGLTFNLPVRDEDFELTGPFAAKLFISSETTDADLFLIVRLFDPEGKEVTFDGSTDPNTPIANGWLRASHRELDLERSDPWRPYHTHTNPQPLEPGEIVELDVEIWPSCIVVPAGYRLALSVRGKDYEYEGPLDEYGENFYYATRGTGGMTHDDPDDRPEEVFGGKVTLYASEQHPSHLLVPLIPPKDEEGPS